MEQTYTITSSEKRARFAITFILLTVSLSVLMGVMGYFELLIRNGTIALSDLNIVNTYSIITRFLVVAYFIMFWASAICFIMWFWKAYSNLKELGCWTLGARGWTIGCWFIPLANLYLPYMYMREMFDGINDLLRDKNELNMKWASSRQVLIWWILFVCVFLFNQFSRQLDIFLFHNDGAYLAYLLTNIILWIASGILAIRMIRSYVAAEKELMTKPDNDDNLNL